MNQPGLLRFILSVLIYLVCFSTIAGQPSEIGLTTNPALISDSPNGRRTVQQQIIKLYVQENKAVQFCDFASLIQEPLDSILIEPCKDLFFGSIDLNDECFNYISTGGFGKDILCLTVCDSNDACVDFKIHITVGATINQPIVDDFAYDGPIPDNNIWLDRDVYINNTLAYQPYSVGVATFDGLDERGTPYPGGPGFADALTSSFIDLSGTSEEMFLSFFMQPKGLGLKPKIKDSLVVDFRKADGRWLRVWAHEGLSNGFSASTPPPEFAFHRIVIPDSLMHDGFQFRFRNKAKNEGLQELWHVDYVRLGNEDVTKEVFRDIAFTLIPKSILSPYTSMPSNQFIVSEVRPNVFSSVRNFDQFNVGMNDPTMTVFHDGTNLMSRTFIEPVSNWTLAPGTIAFDFALNDGGSTNLQKLQSGMEDVVVAGENYQFDAVLTFTRGDEISGAANNNQVVRRTLFSNYLAYDDGTAESAIIDQGTGSQRTILANEYHINVNDKLQGVQIMFPHIEGDISSQRFNLKVWIDTLDDEPEYEARALKPFYPDQFFDTLQGFTTYDLRDTADEKIAIDLPAGRFFIGWEQVDLSGLKISVGYDLNSPEGSEFFHFNTGDLWTRVGNSGIVRQGALMIRPILGNETVISTPTLELSSEEIQIYPNPSTGIFNLQQPADDRQNWKIEVFNQLGQRILQGPLQSQFDLTDHTPGTYFAVLIDGNSGQKVCAKLLLVD